MYRQHCGRQLNDNENFCPGCGAMKPVDTVNSTDFQYDLGAKQPVNTVDTVNEAGKNAMAARVFKWGMRGIIFAHTVLLSLLGVIFSAIAKKQAEEFERTYGEIKGRALAGRILGRIGFGLGLGLTIFMVVYVFMIVILIMTSL